MPSAHLAVAVTGRTVDAGGAVAYCWDEGAAVGFKRRAGQGFTPDDGRTFTAPVDLWADVLSRLRPQTRLVLWGHQIARLLRLSDALRMLPALGLPLDAIALRADAAWAKFTDGSRTVLCVDLQSWAPASLTVLRGDLSVPDAPARRAGAHPWDNGSIALRDAQTIAQAACQCLALVAAEHLGPWRPTGAGQSHAAWRHRFLTDRPLIHDHVDALAAERRACWTGRAEAWQHGELTAGPYCEIDLTAAYCQIAADLDLPAVLCRDTGRLGPGEYQRLTEAHRVLAHCTITTREPVVPTLHGGHIVWPAGRFTTTLWDPEIDLALANGADVRITRAWAYERRPVLAAAARYVLDRLTADAEDVTAVQRRMLKHWARALIGRCALRYGEWADWGTAADDGLSLGAMLDYHTGEEVQVLHVGHRLRALTAEREAPDSLPQIPGWVMSECRRRLWQLTQAVGAEHVAYLDTDAVIVDAAGYARLQGPHAAPLPWPWHLKGQYSRLRIFGPRMLELDGQRRWAGVPLAAQASDDGLFDCDIPISLAESLRRGEPARVDVQHRRIELAPADVRREHLPDGRTTPIALEAPC